jgi:hypothetical protein
MGRNSPSYRALVIEGGDSEGCHERLHRMPSSQRSVHLQNRLLYKSRTQKMRINSPSYRVLVVVKGDAPSETDSGLIHRRGG